MPIISCRHKRNQQQRYGNIRHHFHQLNFREGIDDGNGDTDTSAVAVATKPSSNQSLSGTATTLHRNSANSEKSPIDNHTNSSNNNNENSPIISSSKTNEKSTLRLMKARRLLEMAQITPSQRLETMQNSNNKGMNDDYFTTVVPMGSYSMRFGGFGYLEEELEQPAPLPSQSAVVSQQQQQQHHQGMYELRMADTFDSVDNLVDSKSSLLPGGRWMSTDDSSAGGNASFSTTTKGTQRQSQPQPSSSSVTTTSSRTSIVAVAEPLVQYDPIAAEQLLFVQPTKWLVRNVQIAFPFGLWVAGILMDNIFAVEKVNRKKRARELNSIIGSLGPAIISKLSRSSSL